MCGARGGDGAAGHKAIRLPESFLRLVRILLRKILERDRMGDGETAVWAAAEIAGPGRELDGGTPVAKVLPDGLGTSRPDLPAPAAETNRVAVGHGIDRRSIRQMASERRQHEQNPLRHPGNEQDGQKPASAGHALRGGEERFDEQRGRRQEEQSEKQMERTPEIEVSRDGLSDPLDGFAGRQEPGDAIADTVRVFGVFRGWIHFAFFADFADLA